MTKFIQDSTASISEWSGYRTIWTEPKSTFSGQLHLFVTEIFCLNAIKCQNWVQKKLWMFRYPISDILSDLFTLMVTWGSNNYFVTFLVLLVWFWSDFGLSLVWMFKNYKISLFSQILMKKVEILGSFFESKNYFITKKLKFWHK